MKTMWPLKVRWCLASLLCVVAPPLLEAKTALNQTEPWPRVRSTNGNTITLHLPQVERWTSNWFSARAVVEVKPVEAKKTQVGVVWFEAHGNVDRSNRLVTLDRLEVTKGRFPDAPDKGTNALALVRQVIPAGECTVDLDYLVTVLGFAQVAARQGTRGLKHSPPEIIWATNRTVLVLIDGQPVLRPVDGTSLERVVNTPELLVREKSGGRYYLSGAGLWFAADSISGPWSLVQTPPDAVAALAPAKPEEASSGADQPVPRIIVSTSPAELVVSSGLPDYRPIRGTALSYMADTDSQLFFHNTERRLYLLISGRWFQSTSLRGPWTYVPPHDLPADFAKIPSGSPQAMVLASVPDTRQAELALIANSVPTTATVNRHTAKLDLKYDGEPKFKSIEGTPLSYAANAPMPVIFNRTNYYALENGVWFEAASPTGPWQVAAEVPEEIYTIPPSSPVYYATFARIYDANEDEVETGYTAGYTGTYETDGTTVYGTGYDYEDWYGEEYYGWGWTWGYGYWYVPWYQWWVWRPWWTPAGGLRAAVIENIYDRWQSPHVTPHDRIARAAAAANRSPAFTGHPALYGRFRAGAKPAALAPPANALAVNPYTRPPSATRANDIPRGAQLLTSVRQAPGGGRDLYASPDGNVYRRKPDGWYRQSAGGWSYFAPTQGSVERGSVGSAPRVTPATHSPTARTAGRGDRVPNVGADARAQEVAELERQYFARSLAQMRAQQARPAHVSRPARGGGRRR